jgi:D-alanyl-D-alanine carboxypeptidase (penicillin-binding protein 5/6)
MIRFVRDRSPTVLCAVLAISVGCAVSASAGAATARPSRGASPAITVTVPQQLVPGRRPLLRWPATGEAAVAVASVGLVGESPDQRRVPIASLTKMMTALVVLRDHPLVPGAAGPALVMSSWDVGDWKQDVRAGDSAVEVQAGEVMSEYQALEALLVPSGDNIADRLAIWDAGSIDAFVAKMNRTARRLGLESTRYVDPSGVDPGSASNAADQALVASSLMADPVAGGIVGRQRINLPVVGVLTNRNPALGVDGIVGVKGGYSSHAHNCLVTAAFRAHHAAVVISVALGQPDNLAPARIDETLLQAVTARLDRRRLEAPDAVVGTVTGVGAAVVKLVAPDNPATAVVWPGLALSNAIALHPRGSAQALRSARRGIIVGVLTVSAPWGVLASVPLTVAVEPVPPLRRATRGALLERGRRESNLEAVSNGRAAQPAHLRQRPRAPRAPGAPAVSEN